MIPLSPCACMPSPMRKAYTGPLRLSGAPSKRKIKTAGPGRENPCPVLVSNPMPRKTVAFGTFLPIDSARLLPRLGHGVGQLQNSRCTIQGLICVNEENPQNLFLDKDQIFCYIEHKTARPKKGGLLWLG